MYNNALDSKLSLDTPSENYEIERRETELDPQHFQQVPHVLINDVAKKRLKPIDVVVYIVLKKHLGQKAYCWAGNSTVARLCGVSNATVRRSIKNLIRAGHIERMDCNTGKTARTYFRSMVVNGRAVCGVPPTLPPRQSCKTQTPVAPVSSPTPVIQSVATIEAGREIDAESQATIDAHREEIEAIREAEVQMRCEELFQAENNDDETPF